MLKSMKIAAAAILVAVEVLVLPLVAKASSTAPITNHGRK